MVVAPLLLLLAAGAAAVSVPYHDDRILGPDPRPPSPPPTPAPRPQTHCSKVIPGFARQVLGVDITALDLLPTHPVTHEDGFKGPVLTLTCNSGKKYTIDGVEYDLPDQVWHVEELRTGSAMTEVLKTSQKARETMSAFAGIDTATTKFAFSQATTFSQMEQTINKNEKKLEQTCMDFSARQVSVMPKEGLTMSTGAQNAYTSLPSDYVQDPHPYEDFISQYGTHYFSEAKFGGVMLGYMETLTDYYEFNAESDVAAQAAATFNAALQTKGVPNPGPVEIDEKFSSNTTVSIRYYGGDARLMEEEGLSKWRPTISAKPWLYKGVLKPICDLFDDENKKLQMNMAIKDYVLLKYLTVEQPRIIKTLPAKAQTKPEAQSLLREIEDMSKVRPLMQMESEVLEMGKRVLETYKSLFLDYHADFDDFWKVNTWDNPLDFLCKGGKSITHIYSEHSNQAEDREWSLGCNYLPGLGMMTKCNWTSDHVNEYDQPLDYTCPGGGVMKGWHSVHNNSKEDRIWKYMCCQVEDAVPESCQWTDYLNGWDSPISLRLNVTQEVLTGASSYHDNHAEDRRWKYLVCKQLRFQEKEEAEQRKKQENPRQSLAAYGESYGGETFPLPEQQPSSQPSQSRPGPPFGPRRPTSPGRGRGPSSPGRKPSSSKPSKFKPSPPGKSPSGRKPSPPGRKPSGKPSKFKPSPPGKSPSGRKPSPPGRKPSRKPSNFKPSPPGKSPSGRKPSPPGRKPSGKPSNFKPSPPGKSPSGRKPSSPGRKPSGKPSNFKPSPPGRKPSPPGRKPSPPGNKPPKSKPSPSGRRPSGPSPSPSPSEPEDPWWGDFVW